MFAKVGYHLYANDFTITPLASLQYTRVNIDSYSETGAGNAGLAIDEQSYDFVESGLGVKLARPFGTGSGTIVPEVHANWFHEISNPTLSNTAAFLAPGSDKFTTTGMDTSDDLYNLGAGITFLSCACSGSTWSLEGVGDVYSDANSYTGSQFMLKLTSNF